MVMSSPRKTHTNTGLLVNINPTKKYGEVAKSVETKQLEGTEKEKRPENKLGPPFHALTGFFNYKKDAPWYDSEIFKKWYDEFEGRKVFTILTLFVWKDNSLFEYIVNGKPITNYDITCGDFFTSLEDTHMIIESLEETIKSISAKQKSLLEDGYINVPNSLIYDIWEGILSTQTLSFKSIQGIYLTLKEANEINENENTN